MTGFGFTGPAYSNAAPAIAADRCVNLYLEKIESGHGKSGNNFYLAGTPGLKKFTTLRTGPVRCLWSGDNRLFAVGGSRLYEVFGDGTISELGDVGAATTPAQIFANGEQLFIVSGAQGYLAYGQGSGITVQPVVPAVAGAFLDGYFLAQQPDSNQFRISALLGPGPGMDGGLSWDPLDFAAKEGSADRLAMSYSDHSQLWLFGKKTTEVWYNSGNANFPFQRIQGATIEQGCWAPWSVCKLDNSLFWLGGDDRGIGVVWRAQGYTPIRVSNHAIEFAIQSYANSSDAIGYPWQFQGHQFYVLHFPSADHTWMYDTATGAWFEWLSWNAAEGRYHAHVGRFYAFAYLPVPGTSNAVQHHFLGDHRNGNIYAVSPEYFDDDGSPIRRLRSAPHISNEMKWVGYKALQLDMQVGGSKVYFERMRAEGGNPQVMMRWSDDGGFTWSNEKLCSAGKIGEYLYRVRWRLLGRSRQRAFEVSISDPIQVAILDALVDAFPGTGA